MVLLLLLLLASQIFVTTTSNFFSKLAQPTDFTRSGKPGVSVFPGIYLSPFSAPRGPLAHAPDQTLSDVNSLRCVAGGASLVWTEGEIISKPKKQSAVVWQYPCSLAYQRYEEVVVKVVEEAVKEVVIEGVR